MTLVYDDYNETWVWVATDNHDMEVSPQFDYEEDARAWYTDIKAFFSSKAIE